MKFKLCSLLFIASQAFASVNLEESYRSARLNMETLKREDALVGQSKQQLEIAKSFFFPRVSAVGTIQKIDAPEVPAGGAVRAFALTEQHLAAIRLNQPLLRGGSVAAYELARDNVLLSEFQKNASEVNLYRLVIDAYFNLLIAQRDLDNLEEFFKLSRERVSEVKRLTNVGRSRRGELAQAEAQMLAAQSQLQQGKIVLREARERFHFFTKLRPEKLGPLPPVPEEIGRLEEFIDRVKTRPDILAALKTVEASQRRIEISKGGHYPSLDLTSNYYLSRTGILASSDWDVGLSLSIPLFQGGEVQASVKEAVEGRRVAQLRASESYRAAERDVIIFHQNYLQALAQLKLVREALKKAEEAYRLNSKDYQFGLATNLDVLQSLNLFVETKRSYTTLEALTHMTHRNLEAAVGVLP